MSAAVSRRKKWTQAAIIIGLMLLVGFIPPIDPITETGMQVLGIFLGCIYGWSLGEMVWPSILAMVLLGYVGENTVTAIFSAGFGDQNVLTVLFCMLMAYGIERSGFLNVITRWILSKKFATKGPWWLCFAFFTASAGASLICAPIAVSVLCWSLFFNVADVLKLRRYSSYVTVVMIGIAVSAYLGGIVRPYAGFAQACFGMLRSAAPDIVISYAAYSLTMFIITVFAVPLLALLCKALFRYKEEWSIPDKLFESKDDVIKLNKKQYLVLFYIIALCFLMMVPSYLPDSLAIKDILSQLGLVGSLGLLCVAMALSIDKNGESILDIGKGVVEGVPWGLIFMLAAAMVISPMIVSDDTGISVAILNILNPIVSGMNSTVFIAFMVIIGMILTNCVNNMVVASLLIPISIPILESNGGSIPLMVALFSMTLTQGIVMPGGSALGAMLHGQKEWLKSTMVYKYATVMMLFLAIVISVIGIFVGNYIFSVL